MTIVLKGISENNLKNISLEIPTNKIITVVGVSGSGKSSLCYDVIVKESQRRFLESFQSFQTHLAGKLERPTIEIVNGLPPVVALQQKQNFSSSKSTVGTLSELYDFLRLLFARFGSNDSLSKSHFSFNTKKGACTQCFGLGLEEKIHIDSLLKSDELSLREGVLTPTLPNGYVMYSQVTLEVLDLVCKAHDFSIDTKWKDMTKEQQNVLLYGSDRLKVPYGKHSLESRLKWSGIEAKPREEGFYKGLVIIMSDILKRDRNANILKYVHSITCTKCLGKRINSEALNSTFHTYTIGQLIELEFNELSHFFKTTLQNSTHLPTNSLIASILEKLDRYIELGLGYLTLERSSSELSTGEFQRIRLANQAGASLRGVLYVFDEPAAGLHPSEYTALFSLFQELKKLGNTILLVEHSSDFIKNADWIIELGPEAGQNGGNLIFNGSKDKYFQLTSAPTLDALNASEDFALPNHQNTSGKFSFNEINFRNLKIPRIEFIRNGINLIVGKSGAGKSSLLTYISQQKSEFKQLFFATDQPIGKNSRSNPATYTGIADLIRDVFTKTPDSKKKGYKKGQFSFNSKGGRCESCLGGGKIVLGMHFLSNIEVPCDTCKGNRFNKETLSITYKETTIAAVYKMTILEAFFFFTDEKKIQKALQVLIDIGLGYLQLGQSSSTLSGGEAQRIKLATHLIKNEKGETLFLFDEPTTGLHLSDERKFYQLLNSICQKNNTVICADHEPSFQKIAHQVLTLGPESGKFGGKLINCHTNV